MIKFNKDIDTAINLVNLLTEKPSTVGELCIKLEIQDHSLQRVVRKLNSRGVIKTTKGKGGGVCSSGKMITLWDIFHSFYDDPLLELQQKDDNAGLINVVFISFLQSCEILKSGNVLKNLKIYEEPSDKVIEKEDEPKEDPVEEELDLSEGW